LPALATRLQKDMREYGLQLTFCRLIDEGDASILGAITTQPEFARALEIARSTSGERPGMWDWVMARLAGDTASAEKVAGSVFDEEARQGTLLGQLLTPGNAADAYVTFTERHTPKP